MRLFTLLCMVISIVTPALADEVYYIEVGNEASQAEILSKWQARMEKHKEMLGALKTYPLITIRPNGEISNRIYAGPIADKSQAQKICKLLFAGDMPCFVLEGAGYPENSVISGQIPVQQSIPNYLPWNAPPKPESLPER